MSLVESGCLYFCAWGAESSDWHDAVDLACLERHNFDEVPDDEFVMTTWHDKEPLAQAFWYFKNLAFHASVEIAKSLVVHIGESNREIEFADAFVRVESGL